MKQSPAAAAFSEVLAGRRSKPTDWVGILALALSLLVVGAAALLGPTWHVGHEAEGIMAGLTIALATWLGLHAAKGWDGRTTEVARLRASVAFEQLVEHLPLVVYVDEASDNAANLYTSPQVEPLLGYTAEQWMSDPDLFVKALHPDDRERVLKLVRDTNESGTGYSSEYRMVHRDGRVVWVLDESTLVRREDGRAVSVQGFWLDITRRREAEERLQTLAWTDELTGLPNRARLMADLDATLAANGSASLVFLDLDDFKTVNDSLGHAAGDQLLASAAQCLRASVRPGDLVARLGGDEFAILTCRDDDVDAIAYRALGAVIRSHSLVGYDVHPTASAGIATGTDAETILRNADLAMYAAKGAGGGAVSAFAPSMLAEAKARLTLSGELRRSGLLDELVLHYQPTFDLRTGRIESVEALVRWQHPVRGLLLPGEFIGHAESTGAINGIGRWALETALAQLAEWQSRSDRPPCVAVNISTIQLRSPDLLGEVTALLLKNELPPQALRLELTESAVLRSDDDSKAVLRSLADIGVQLALDDFGKGYSSVGNLENLPFSILKIDKSFLDSPQPTASPLLRGIIALAKTMELTVVAEGIERQDQLAAVHKLRCEIGQGFYLARPAPAAKITELLAEDRLPRRFTQLHVVE
ncbi:MAG: putative bifunctional diguanylate cyclase/phosphodiesterase [Gaiellaceae bacterium]